METQGHFIPISGKDSLSTALIQTAITPDVDFRFFFNDTGAELPETYAWINKIQKKTGWHIESIGKNLQKIIEQKDYLPSVQRRYCTSVAKIEPMEKWLSLQSLDKYHVYFGLRADEQERVGYRNLSKLPIVSHYPLKEKGIRLEHTYLILQAKDLLPPSFFWQGLWDDVESILNPLLPLGFKIGETWKNRLTQHEKRMLFSGRSRTNCYFCFFQRQYELVWLAETHPDLFDMAVHIEENNGKEGFYWKDYPLKSLLSRKEEIRLKRAKQVIKYILNKDTIDIDSEIALTSCGLMCGK